MTDPTSPHDPSSGSPPPEPPLPRWARTPPPGLGEITEARLAAYIGPKWETTYRHKLAPFLEDPTFVPTWNWSAALVGFISPAWFLYRKLYLPFVLFFLAEPVALNLLLGDTALPQTVADMAKPENLGIARLVFAVKLSTILAAGGSANWFLFRRARAANRFASAQGVAGEDALSLMAHMGGVNRLATALFLAMSMVLGIAQLRG